MFSRFVADTSKSPFQRPHGIVSHTVTLVTSSPLAKPQESGWVKLVKTILAFVTLCTITFMVFSNAHDKQPDREQLDLEWLLSVVGNGTTGESNTSKTILDETVSNAVIAAHQLSTITEGDVEQIVRNAAVRAITDHSEKNVDPKRVAYLLEKLMAQLNETKAVDEVNERVKEPKTDADPSIAPSETLEPKQTPVSEENGAFKPEVGQTLLVDRSETSVTKEVREWAPSTGNDSNAPSEAATGEPPYEGEEETPEAWEEGASESGDQSQDAETVGAAVSNLKSEETSSEAATDEPQEAGVDETIDAEEERALAPGEDETPEVDRSEDRVSGEVTQESSPIEDPAPSTSFPGMRFLPKLSVLRRSGTTEGDSAREADSPASQQCTPLEVKDGMQSGTCTALPQLPVCIGGAAFSGGDLTLHMGAGKAFHQAMKTKQTQETLDALPPRDFVGRRPGSGRKLLPSCAVVASSRGLFGRGLGASIDQHAVVIRINNAPTKGFENDVGNRTTIRFTQMDAEGFRRHAEEVVISGSWCRTPPCAVSRLREALDRKVHPLNPAFLEHTSSNLRAPTAGFVAVLLALHSCAKVGVYGFDALKETQQANSRYSDDEESHLPSPGKDVRWTIGDPGGPTAVDPDTTPAQWTFAYMPTGADSDRGNAGSRLGGRRRLAATQSARSAPNRSERKVGGGEPTPPSRRSRGSSASPRPTARTDSSDKVLPTKPTPKPAPKALPTKPQPKVSKGAKVDTRNSVALYSSAGVAFPDASPTVSSELENNVRQEKLCLGELVHSGFAKEDDGLG